MGHQIATARTTNTNANGEARFNWMVVLLSGWMIGGIHLDAWAHHRIAETLESFFTPWHGVLYSGFFALAALLVGRVWQGVRSGQTWQQAIPKGYAFSLVGVGLFFLGGAGDMLWHLLFGIEVNTEALLSPTHLLLALGGGLMVSGPVRTAWDRTSASGPALIALAYLLSLFWFFTAYANPLSEASEFFQGTRPSDALLASFSESLGVASILLTTALMMGVVLLVTGRWRLRWGSLTLLLGLSSLLTLSVHQLFWLWPVVLLAGLAADGLYSLLNPEPNRVAWQLFAALVPALFFALYFAALALNGGLWWSIHLWAGSVVMAGMLGWLLSFAFSKTSSVST